MRIRLKESIDTRIKYEENRKELMAGISHDLRTPLTAIKGYVEGLRDNVANTPEKQKKYLNTIYYKACDMDRLVEELFLFSKLDTGKFPFKFDIIKINDYINNFYLKIKEEFLNKGLEIFLANDCNEKDKVNIDCKQMDRVLLNIIENSYKYKKDSIGTCKINMYEKENDIVIKISDNGKGVSEEELEKIFISFYRCDPSRTKTNEGSGLGLAIAKQIIDNHKGKIRAYSNNGLVIEILIPKILSD
ncbi:putative Histidine kinase [Clostridium neonatale]|nr:putative Histidine kinase [Clostridium neonatale]